MRHPEVRVRLDLTGPEGNALCVIGKVVLALRKEHPASAEVFQALALQSPSYGALFVLIQEFVNISVKGQIPAPPETAETAAKPERKVISRTVYTQDFLEQLASEEDPDKSNPVYSWDFDEETQEVTLTIEEHTTI